MCRYHHITFYYPLTPIIPFASARHAPNPLSVLVCWMRNGANRTMPCSALVRTSVHRSDPSLRLRYRSMPTFHGLPLSPHAGGSQPASSTDASQLSSHSEGICCYMLVKPFLRGCFIVVDDIST